MRFKTLGFRTTALLAGLTLAGCASLQENQKSIFGGVLGGAAVGGACMLTRGNPILCGVLAIAGAAAGSAIGHSLDARDHAKREAAVVLALQLAPPPVGQALPPGQPSPVRTTAYAGAAPQPARAPAPRRVALRRLPASAATRVAGGPPGGADPWVNPDGAVQWVNPDTNNSGSVIATRSFADPATGQTCHDLDESYVRAGKRTTQAERACQQANGSWSFKDVAG